MHESTWLNNFPLPIQLYYGTPYNHINGSIVVVLFLVFFGLAVHVKLKSRHLESFIIPSEKLSLISIFDFMVESLLKMVQGVLGEKTAFTHLPFIGSMFLFIFMSNILSLLPEGEAPTANINTTLALGVVSFFYYNIFGIRTHGFVGYLKHFLMGLGPLGVLIALLEMVSHAIRPVSLGVRLFVNMHVDHNLLLSFESLCRWILPVPLLLFGLIVSTIQAFVFSVLTAVYVQMATEIEEH